MLGYNTDKTTGQVPEGWADFFDTTKIPGKRGVWDYSEGGMFEFALMADGVAPRDLYPLDLPRATKKLDTIKDDIVFWNSGAESQELIGSGEVAMSMIWNGRGLERQEHRQEAGRDPVEPADRHGGLPRRAQGLAQQGCGDEVHRVHRLRGEQRAAVASTSRTGRPTRTPRQSGDGRTTSSVTNADENSAYFDDEYLVNNFDEIDAAWQAWKGG